MSLTVFGDLIYSQLECLQNDVDTLLEDIENAKQNPQRLFTITFPHALEFIVNHSYS